MVTGMLAPAGMETDAAEADGGVGAGGKDAIHVLVGFFASHIPNDFDTEARDQAGGR